MPDYFTIIGFHGWEPCCHNNRQANYIRRTKQHKYHYNPNISFHDWEPCCHVNRQTNYIRGNQQYKYHYNGNVNTFKYQYNQQKGWTWHHHK